MVVWPRGSRERRSFSSGVSGPSESTKKARPPGLSADRTRSQNLSKRSGGTCESQNPKKTAS